MSKNRSLRSSEGALSTAILLVLAACPAGEQCLEFGSKQHLDRAQLSLQDRGPLRQLECDPDICSICVRPAFKGPLTRHDRALVGGLGRYRWNVGPAHQFRACFPG